MRGFGWLDRWRRSGGRYRIHQYTRYTLYSFAVAEAALIVVWAMAMPETAEGWVRGLVAVVGGGHVVLNVVTCRLAIDHYLGTGPRPDRALGCFAVLTLLGVALGLWIVATGRMPDQAGVVVSYFPAFLAGPVAVALTIPRATQLIAAVTVVSAAGALAAGTTALAMLVMPAFFAATFRMSVWTLRVVDRLDEARETEARLAVAEERLRFSRDLHDVLGRNLSVIALKSELATQLAQRESAAAADQMVEVQRIARESQHEMREVVRGYREANLHTELAGARGVLEAAGIRCEIDETGAGAPAGGAPLSPAVQAVFGWVVREGTTNVLRHANAARCAIRVRLLRGDVAELEMENDGALPEEGGPSGGRGTEDGSDDGPDGGPGHGSGLPGLRERLAALGGSLRADRRDGGVFRLTARLPSATRALAEPGVPGPERPGTASGPGPGTTRGTTPGPEADQAQRQPA